MGRAERKGGTKMADLKNHNPNRIKLLKEIRALFVY